MPNLLQTPITATLRSLLHTLTLTTLFTLLNPITPLLLTGGEPVNRTYLWAGWAFHGAWVSRNYTQAAAMILWMVPILMGISFIAWLSSRDRSANIHH